MSTTQTQIKFSVSEQIKTLLDANASALGMPVASYVRYLVTKEVEEDAYPVFKMSKRTEKIAKKAMKDYKNAVTIDDVDEYFDNL